MYNAPPKMQKSSSSARHQLSINSELPDVDKSIMNAKTKKKTKARQFIVIVDCLMSNNQL